MVKHIFLVFIGVLIGAAIGLYLGWVAWPTEFTDANPAALNNVERRDYALMTAVVYADTHDLQTARRRAASLGEDGEAAYFSITMDSILRSDNAAEIQLFVELADALGHTSPAMEPFLPLAEGVSDE